MDNIDQKSGTFWGAALIIAGTCIGAGMLAMPVETGPAGFYPALIVNGLCWLFMVATGLLFLEATLWLPDGANVLSMADRLLGKSGKWIGGIAFLFLYYCLLVAYIDGGSAAVSTMSKNWLGFTLADWAKYGIFTSVFAAIVWLGTRAVDRINWILMMGLILSYFLLIGIGSSQVDFSFFERRNWSLTWPAIPVLFSAYGYHNVIPSMSTYLKRDEKKIRWAIMGGMLIPLIVYGLWLWLIIGSVPEEGLIRLAKEGTPVTSALEQVTQRSAVHSVALFFGFFAIITSLLGVALSMVDFLGDGFGIVKRTGIKRAILCLMVFLPPFFLAKSHTGVFKEALGYAGGFGEAILNGLFPVMMVWIGRYKLRLRSQYRLPGGKLILGLLFVLSLAVIVIEVLHLMMYF